MHYYHRSITYCLLSITAFFAVAIHATAQDLYEVIAKGDTLALLELVEKRPEVVNLKGDGISSPLFFAVDQNQAGSVEILLRYGATVETEDSAGRTPLFFARNSSVAKLLLEHGASVNHISSRGTPLHSAVESRRRYVVDALIEHGADVSLGYWEDVRQYGLDSPIVAERHISPLYLAAYNDDPRIVKILIKTGANAVKIVDEGHTILHHIVRLGNLRTLKLLLDEGVDPNAPSCTQHYYGMPPISLSKNIDQIYMLIDYGADVNLQVTRGITPLFHLYDDLPQSIPLLIEAGASINHQSHDGTTPLHWSATRDRFASMKQLLEHGADVNIVDTSGKSPLLNLMEKWIGDYLYHEPEAVNKWTTRYEHIFDLNYDAGPTIASFAVTTNEEYSIAYANSSFDHSDDSRTMRLLLEHGADPNVTVRKTTSLHLAASAGIVEAVELLLLHHANQTLKDSEGLTPLDIARKAGYNNIVEILTQSKNN